MFEDRAAIFSALFVSTYNQMNDKKETRGMEARIPPISEERLDISEMITMITAVISTLKI